VRGVAAELSNARRQSGLWLHLAVWVLFVEAVRGEIYFTPGRERGGSSLFCLMVWERLDLSLPISLSQTGLPRPLFVEHNFLRITRIFKALSEFGFEYS